MRARASALLLLAVATPATADEPLDYRAYLTRVLETNPDLAATHVDVDIARSQIDVARVFPDPQLTAGLTQLDVTGQGNPTAAGLQLSVPLELGGKRPARVAAAEAGVGVAQLDYEDALRALRAQAAGAFVEALYARLVVAQKERSSASLAQLAAANQERLRAGDIPEAAVLQSEVEAQQFQAEVLAARGARDAADVALVQLLGVRGGAGFSSLTLAGELRAVPSAVEPGPLLAALERRTDVLAATKRVEAAEKQLELARANRVIDLSVGAGWQHNFAVGGAPVLPASDFVGANLSVPLPFSRVYSGELQAASSARLQAQLQLKAIRVRAEGELRQALALFAAAASRVALYEGGTLTRSKAVLEKTLYNYQRGGASLVEVLIAQRTDSDVNLAYLDALADRARALVAVEQATGLSDGVVHF